MMTLSKDQIMTEALKLGPQDRESLAEELLLSINDADRDQIDAAWLSEAHRRDTAFRAGQTHANSVDAVIQRLTRKGQP